MPQRKTLNRALLIVTPKQPFYDCVDEVFAGREMDVMDECWSGLIDHDWEIKELERFPEYCSISGLTGITVLWYGIFFRTSGYGGRRFKHSKCVSTEIILYIRANARV